MEIDIDKINKRCEEILAEHQMTIIEDNDQVRCLRFGKPNRNTHSFTVLTRGLYLIMYGDVGDIIFKFSDSDPLSYFHRDSLDHRYLFSKVVEACKDHYKEYDLDNIRKNVMDKVREWLEDELYDETNEFMEDSLVERMKADVEEKIEDIDNNLGRCDNVHEFVDQLYQLDEYGIDGSDLIEMVSPTVTMDFLYKIKYLSVLAEQYYKQRALAEATKELETLGLQIPCSSSEDPANPVDANHL